MAYLVALVTACQFLVTQPSRAIDVSFGDATPGGWDQVGEPAGWSTSDASRVASHAGGEVRIERGVTASYSIGETVSAHDRYILHAMLGGSIDTVACVRLRATENADGSGASFVLAQIERTASGDDALSLTSTVGDSAVGAATGYHLQLELSTYSANGAGFGSFAELSVIAKPLDPVYDPLLERGIECIEFNVPVRDHLVTATIASPPAADLDPDPVLLLTIGGVSTHFIPPNAQPAEFFWKRGHRVVSFSFSSMPGSLEVYRDAVIQGPDPTVGFIEEAQAVLQACVDRGWARPGRVVVTGISRFGYLALRLLAADDSLKVGGAFSPVTDWRYLVEFEGQRDMQVVADMRLSLYANQLAGKKVYIAIGSHDERVSTVACCQFFLDLNAANDAQGYGRGLVDFFVTPSPGHTCGDEWFERGMDILLRDAVSR